MTIEEAIREFEKQLHSAVVVLDSGFGTHPGESDRVYQKQKAMAEVALAALRAQQELDENVPRHFKAYEETWLEPETIVSEHSGINSELRKGCPMRHENGNCAPVGGFCTAVNDPICEGLHSAYDAGWHDAALHAQQEAGKYRFYYCESEDSYLLGARAGNFYYAHWDGKSFTWDMSRYLPWGEHIVIPEMAWKEHTYPSEPKEIGPDEWFRGFLDQQFRQETKNNAPLTLDDLP